MAVFYLEVVYRCARPTWPMRHALVPLSTRERQAGVATDSPWGGVVFVAGQVSEVRQTS